MNTFASFVRRPLLTDSLLKFTFFSGSSVSIERATNGTGTVTKLVLHTDYGTAALEPEVDGSSVSYDCSSGMITVDLPDDRANLSFPFLMDSDKSMVIFPCGRAEVHQSDDSTWIWLL